MIDGSELLLRGGVILTAMGALAGTYTGFKQAKDHDEYCLGGALVGLIIGGGGTCIVLALLSVLGYAFWWAVTPPSPEDSKVTLTSKYWVCTIDYISHHPEGRSGKTWHEAYDTVECSQWSAKMGDGSIAGNLAPASRYYK